MKELALRGDCIFRARLDHQDTADRPTEGREKLNGFL